MACCYVVYCGRGYSGKMRRLTVVALLVCLCMVTGCGVSELVTSYRQHEASAPAADIATLGYVPQFDYEYTEQSSRVTIDKVGYLPSGKKVIYIEGTDLDRGFSLVDTDTDEAVYTGRLRKVSDSVSVGSDLKELYIGDFTEFNMTGSYRIYQADVGYSYEFDIDRNCHSELYDDIYKTIANAKYMQTGALVYTLANLMLTHEIYEESYTNDAFIKGGIEALLLQQHPRTGAVYKELQDEETLQTITEELRNPAAATINTDSMVSLAATAELAGVFAQYYYDYHETDRDTATEALRAAGKAYSYVERYRDGVNTDSMYYAACQLYRATGQYKYRNAIAYYDTIPERSRNTSIYDYTMLADLAYLSTDYRTDYDRCETLMAKYRDLASDISLSVSRQNYYVQDNIESLTEDEILYNMMTLGFVSYILSGREYASIQSNYLHYLFGINPDMVDYYTQPLREGELPLCIDIVRLSKFIFILGNGE